MKLKKSVAKKENIRADIESQRFILSKYGNEGYCDILSPIGPIFNSKLLALHYRVVHSLAIIGIKCVRYLEVRQMKIASDLEESNGFIDANTSYGLFSELLISHCALKQQILDDLKKIKSPVELTQNAVKWSIHKTLFRQYIYAVRWLIAFV